MWIYQTWTVCEVLLNNVNILQLGQFQALLLGLTLTLTYGTQCYITILYYTILNKLDILIKVKKN